MIRIIPRLDVKGQNLIKSIQLEGLRVVGDPVKFAVKYHLTGADELLLMDSVASLYGRNNLFELIKKITSDIFIPITLGGGLRNRDDVVLALRSGADKFAINSAAIENIQIIQELAEMAGKQSVVLSVEAKKTSSGLWEAYFNNGREKSGREVWEWIDECIEKGVGEVLLTSVDREGTAKGFDIDLLKYVGAKITVPLIISGGGDSLEHINDVAKTKFASGIALANALHYDKLSIGQVKSYLNSIGFGVRI